MDFCEETLFEREDNRGDPRGPNSAVLSATRVKRFDTSPGNLPDPGKTTGPDAPKAAAPRTSRKPSGESRTRKSAWIFASRRGRCRRQEWAERGRAWGSRLGGALGVLDVFGLESRRRRTALECGGVDGVAFDSARPEEKEPGRKENVAVEPGKAPLPAFVRGLGATRRDAGWTFLLLVLVALFLQRQLREGEGSSDVSDVHANLPSDEVNEENSVPLPRPALAPLPLSGRSEAVDARTFRGRIVDPLGRAIRGAQLRLAKQSTASFSDGRFTLRWAAGHLRVEHPNFWTREVRREELLSLWKHGTIDNDALSRSSTSSVILFPATRVVGTVRLPSGEAPDQARVIFSAGERRWEIGVAADGSFESPLLPSATLSLLVLHPKALPYSKVLPPTGAWRHEFNVVLKPGRPLAVHVESSSGEALGDADVWLRRDVDEPEEGGGRSTDVVAGWEFAGWTADLGSLNIGTRSSERTVVRVRAPGYRRVLRSVDEEALTVTMHPSPSIVGEAVSAETGLPVALTHVQLELRGERGFLPCPDPGKLFHMQPGKFVVTLPPFAGTYRLALRGEGSLVGYTETIDFDGESAPETLFVRLEPRSDVAGFVRTEHNVLGQVSVSLVQIAADNTTDGAQDEASGPEQEVLHGVLVPPAYKTVRRAKSDYTGGFRFVGVPPGRYRLRVRAEGWMEYYSPPLHAPVDRELPVILTRGATLKGVVRSPEGLPELNVPLVLTDGDIVRRVAWTDSFGAYEFGDLPAGEYALGLGTSAAVDVSFGDDGDAPPKRATRHLQLRAGRTAVFNLQR